MFAHQQSASQCELHIVRRSADLFCAFATEYVVLSLV